jgi:hypothetical protein
LSLRQCDLLIDGQVVDVHGAVERQGDHLGYLGDLNLSGYLGAVGRAEAVCRRGYNPPFSFAVPTQEFFWTSLIFAGKAKQHHFAP